MATPFKSLFAFAVIVLLTASVNATYLLIEGPVASQLFNNGSIYLGNVGPGESFYILASATTTNQTGKLINIGWDKLEAESLPAGWSAQPSPLYETSMKMKVSVAPFANGTYKLVIRAVNVENYSKLGNLTINAYVNVTRNVFSANVSPVNISAGVGEPINLKIEINNTGASDDPFLINAYKLPGWDTPVEVIAAHSTISTFYYPVYINEPGIYPFNITINGTTSPQIRKSFNIRLVAQASVLNDYGATGQGVVLSPIIYEPAYAFMLLVKDLYSLIFK